MRKMLQMVKERFKLTGSTISAKKREW